MNLNEYQQKAMKTKQIYNELKDQIINSCLGLAGETGEVCEMFKKHFSVGKEIIRKDLIKELGDIMWYIAYLADAYEIEMEEIAQTNIDKLAARHGEKFSGTGDRSGAGK